MALRRYLTGLLSSDYPFFPKPPYRGRGWFITLESTEKSKRFTAAIPDGSKTRLIPGRELIIHASCLESAVHVAFLLNAAETLLDAQSLAWSLLVDEGPWPVPENASELEGLSIVERARHSRRGRDYYGGNDFPLCALIAAKASNRKRLQYALFRYLLSVHLASVDQMSLRPGRDQDHFCPKPYALRHVLYAQSILSSYGVIEDLEVTVRGASRGKPSTTNGKWNPDILHDLQRRLRLAGVNPRATIIWLERGRPTKIEEKRQVQGGLPASYVREDMGDVRDREVPIVEAINYASWIRNSVAAHKLGKLAAELTPIHAVNLQLLARRLLLEKFGVWRRL